MFLRQGYKKKKEHQKALLAPIPFNERILQGFKKMDEDIQRIMCASQGDITEATAQEYSKNQEVVRQAC